MAHQKRGRRGLNHDIINVTDLDDNLEEFSLTSDINPNKSKTRANTTIGHMSTTASNGHLKTSYSDPWLTKPYKDPLKTISVKDPFAEKSKVNLDRSNKPPNTSLKLDSELKRNTTQSSVTNQSGVTKDACSTQIDSHVTKTTPTRGLQSTPLNTNHPVTSIHINKRYTTAPRIDKNKKGFSHEEKDLIIDDIEDF